MSLKITRRVPTVEGATAGNTATIRLPLGLTYERVYLSFGNLSATGVLLSEITGIRVNLNGRVLMSWRSGTELDRCNQFQGYAAAGASASGGVLTVPFTRKGLKTRAAEEFTALGSGLPFGTGADEDPTPLQQATIEIDFDAATTAISLQVSALQSVPQPLGLIRKVLRYDEASAGASPDFILENFSKGDIYDQVYMFEGGAGGAINRVTINRDQFLVFDRTKLLNDVIQADGVRTPQSDLFVYDPTEQGNGSEGLVTAQVNDLEIKLDVAGAVNVESNVYAIGGLNT